MTSGAVGEPSSQNRRGWLFWLGWVLFALSALFWIAIAVTLIVELPRIDEPGRAVGRLIGRFAFPLVLVLIGRFIYVRLRRPPRPRFWSPWILVITTLLAILVAVPTAFRNMDVSTAEVSALASAGHDD